MIQLLRSNRIKGLWIDELFLQAELEELIIMAVVQATD